MSTAHTTLPRRMPDAHAEALCNALHPRTLRWLFLGLVLVGQCCAQEAAAQIFTKGVVPRLEFTLGPEGMAALKAAPRTYTRASLLVDKKTSIAEVGLRLKGAAGSYRDIDDAKPGFTVSLAKFGTGELHGLTKFHLNNCAQDESYLNEWLGGELMLAAKVPAARCGHARVFLDGRDLGLYVLKEAFDERFLKRHYADANGNLYDGGFCQDIDAELELDSGAGPEGREDLKALIAACREPEPAARFLSIEKLLDVDRFLSFMAMELMLGHWDGYCMNRNNYRVHIDPRNNKFVFLPHGMDQILGDAEAAVLDYPVAMVAEAVMRNPDWRARWRQRLTALLPVFARDKWKARIEVWSERLEKPLESISKQAAQSQKQAARGLVQRLSARVQFLAEQAALPEQRTQSFGARGIAKLQGFTASHEGGAPQTRQTTVDRKRALEVAVGSAEPARAAWRRKVMLARGRYEFRANLRLDGATAPARAADATEQPPWGGRLQVPGLNDGSFINTAAAWTPLTVTFEVLEDSRLVELRAESFLGAGAAAFELASLQLIKLKQ